MTTNKLTIKDIKAMIEEVGFDFSSKERYLPKLLAFYKIIDNEYNCFLYNKDTSPEEKPNFRNTTCFESAIRWINTGVLKEAWIQLDNAFELDTDNEYVSTNTLLLLHMVLLTLLVKLGCDV